MGRPKKVIVETKEKPKSDKYTCTCCGKSQNKEFEFYKSNSLLYKANDQRMTICKSCIVDVYDELISKFQNSKIAVYFLCRMLDTYFDASLYESAEQQAINQNSNIGRIYIQKVNSLPQYLGKTFFETVPLEINKENKTENIDGLGMNELDLQNKEDVLRMVGYDPFEFENEKDKKGLYNTLVDMLDESTLEDSFKLPIVIEITKSFNQIDKINQALAILTTDVANINSSVGGVKSLIEAKKSMYTSILAMAKDNGISVNHATNKSKGAGTLSGIMKQLQEKGFMEVEVNLYDIETCEGIRQVADISNKSIINQLNFDENEYTEMLIEQRDLIKNLDAKNIQLEEELRLLKIKNKSENN